MGLRSTVHTGVSLGYADDSVITPFGTVPSGALREGYGVSYSILAFIGPFAESTVRGFPAAMLINRLIRSA